MPKVLSSGELQTFQQHGFVKTNNSMPMSIPSRAAAALKKQLEEKNMLEDTDDDSSQDYSLPTSGGSTDELKTPPDATGGQKPYTKPAPLDNPSSQPSTSWTDHKGNVFYAAGFPGVNGADVNPLHMTPEQYQASQMQMMMMMHQQQQNIQQNMKQGPVSPSTTHSAEASGGVGQQNPQSPQHNYMAPQYFFNQEYTQYGESSPQSPQGPFGQVFGGGTPQLVRYGVDQQMYGPPNGAMPNGATAFT